jgi:hypothetical protein
VSPTERDRAPFTAAPPDAGGHLGVGTRPDEVRQAPGADERSPPLHRDATRSGGEGSGVALIVASLILALAVLVSVLVWWL